MDRARLVRRAATAFLIVGAAILLLATPVAAGVTGNCNGSVTIEGTKYTPDNDTADNPIVLPENRNGLPVEYEGSVDFANTNYLGAVGVVIGPATVNVADWGFDPNDDDVRSVGPKTYILGSELERITGLYQVTAFHDADGGNCDADAFVRLEGDFTDSPVAMGASAGVVLTGAGLLAAGRPKGGKP